MNYFTHFYLNFLVFLKLLAGAFFHLAHGIVPVKYTSHEYWNIGFLAPKEEAQKGKYRKRKR